MMSLYTRVQWHHSGWKKKKPDPIRSQMDEVVKHFDFRVAYLFCCWFKQHWASQKKKKKKSRIKLWTLHFPPFSDSGYWSPTLSVWGLQAATECRARWIFQFVDLTQQRRVNISVCNRQIIIFTSSILSAVLTKYTEPCFFLFFNRTTELYFS